jgi:hypothetical protein
MYHSPMINALWEARSSIFERMMDDSKGSSSSGRRRSCSPRRPLRAAPTSSTSSPPRTSSGSSTGTRGTSCASASCSRISTCSPAPSLSRYLAIAISCRHARCVSMFREALKCLVYSGGGVKSYTLGNENFR